MMLSWKLEIRAKGKKETRKTKTIKGINENFICTYVIYICYIILYTIIYIFKTDIIIEEKRDQACMK